jgi:hypothetical protein
VDVLQVEDCLRRATAYFLRVKTAKILFVTISAVFMRLSTVSVPHTSAGRLPIPCLHADDFVEIAERPALRVASTRKTVP